MQGSDVMYVCMQVLLNHLVLDIILFTRSVLLAAFILPTACYLRLSPSKFCSLDKLTALGVCVFGVVVMVIGTVQAIITTVSSFTDTSPFANPEYCLNGSNLTFCPPNQTALYSCDCAQFCLS